MDTGIILIKIDSGCLETRPWNNFLTNSLGDPEIDGFPLSCHVWNIWFCLYFKKKVMIKGKKSSHFAEG